MTIPNTCPNVDIWVDFEKHHWMDTVELRPLTLRGGLWLRGQIELIAEDDAYLISRRGFDEWFYDFCQESEISLSVTANTTPD